MLKIKDLQKKYKGAESATLTGISLEVKKGEVFGFVGKNGAGKSTTIKCFTGILPFESGEILINGHNIQKEPSVAKSFMGYVPDDHSVYETLTGREYINFMADMYGVGLESRLKFIEKYSEMFSLSHSLDKQISGYSHGMKQKICIMGAIVHEPKLWVLDEPLMGLDPLSAEVIKKCIKDYVKDKSRTVIFSSHDLHTIINLCDRVVVINKGRVQDVFKIGKNSESLLLKYLAENV